ncbi:PREDICTED: leucine-rich repeat-containing protein 15-like [Branchiostoma belcheri]|uniref:Leucine-rich repeat-containing protein 15-like n=1 Tax=Branchiostoma belcheri TaxID=7741 RepID=A0A6P4ZEC6_BRABE|nr:PREDICTED: leucine-rich repeat-containing protein 15-like [Branchiostoma belcheri]
MYIPSDTARLFLSGNTIQSLSHADFSNLTSLAYLDLDNNYISSLPAGVFSHLTRLRWLSLSDNHIADLLDGVFSILTSLEYLDLSNNKISSLPAGVFSHLTRLWRLDLSDNHIADLPDGVFSILTSLNLSNNNISSLPADIKHLSTQTSLYITGNPWRCDCSLQDIMISVRGSIRGNPTCSSPSHMKDDALTGLVSDRICHGSGVCTTGSTEGTCACDVGWTGPYCGEGEMSII